MERLGWTDTEGVLSLSLYSKQIGRKSQVAVRNTPRTKGPLFRWNGHRRRCPGLDAEILSLPFRVTGFREDVGHTLYVQTHVRSVCYIWNRTRMTKYKRVGVERE